MNKTRIEAVAAKVRDRVEASGKSVYYTYIPEPGKYPGDAPVQALLMLLGLLGLLSLILSGFLVVNTISALLTQQTRQIGIMKAVGARRMQIVAMYMAMVLGFGALSLLVGIPLGLLGSYALVSYMVGLLNFNVTSYAPDTHVFIIEIAVGLAVPALAALWPILSGTRITVREALSAESIGARSGRGKIDRALGRLRLFSRLMLISLRNTFRRKGRLAGGGGSGCPRQHPARVQRLPAHRARRAQLRVARSLSNGGRSVTLWGKESRQGGRR